MEHWRSSAGDLRAANGEYRFVLVTAFPAALADAGMGGDSLAELKNP